MGGGGGVVGIGATAAVAAGRAALARRRTRRHFQRLQVERPRLPVRATFGRSQTPLAGSTQAAVRSLDATLAVAAARRRGGSHTRRRRRGRARPPTAARPAARPPGQWQRRSPAPYGTSLAASVGRPAVEPTPLLVAVGGGAAASTPPAPPATRPAAPRPRPRPRHRPRHRQARPHVATRRPALLCQRGKRWRRRSGGSRRSRDAPRADAGAAPENGWELASMRCALSWAARPHSMNTSPSRRADSASIAASVSVSPPRVQPASEARTVRTALSRRTPSLVHGEVAVRRLGADILRQLRVDVAQRAGKWAHVRARARPWAWRAWIGSWPRMTTRTASKSTASKAANTSSLAGSTCATARSPSTKLCSSKKPWLVQLVGGAVCQPGAEGAKHHGRRHLRSHQTARRRSHPRGDRARARVPRRRSAGDPRARGTTSSSCVGPLFAVDDRPVSRAHNKQPPARAALFMGSHMSGNAWKVSIYRHQVGNCGSRFAVCARRLWTTVTHTT